MRPRPRLIGTIGFCSIAWTTAAPAQDSRAAGRDTAAVLAAMAAALRPSVGRDASRPSDAVWYAERDAAFTRRLAGALGLQVRTAGDAAPVCPWSPGTDRAAARGLHAVAWVRLDGQTAEVTLRRWCFQAASARGLRYETDATYRLARGRDGRWRIASRETRVT